MIDNPFYSPLTQGDFKLFDLGNLVLESGETLRGAKLAYRIFGTLNADKSNAVLVTTWFSGTGKVMQDVYVGPGHALNPERFFIIIVEQLGSGVSSSPHNMPAPQTMAKFPKLSIGDDVSAQHRLLTEVFGIDELALVVGGSMGGQQVYEWAVAYPEMVRRAAVIAATARISLHQRVFVQALIEAVTSDHFRVCHSPFIDLLPAHRTAHNKGQLVDAENFGQQPVLRTDIIPNRQFRKLRHRLRCRHVVRRR